MSLQSAWIDALFAKLAVRYGAAFMRQWPDADIEAVKADWADVLDGLSGVSIRYGLENLPADKPPNALQFRAICNRRPDEAPLAIAHKALAEPEKVAALVASVKTEQARDTKAWARRLKDIEENRGGILPSGQKMTRAQREMWRDALRAAA